MITYNVSEHPSGKHYFEGVCLSSDSKPTGGNICNGSKLLELDTATLYIYDEENNTWGAWE